MVSLKKILNKILRDLQNTFKKSDTIPISHGGTGATTVAAARTNLNVPSIDKIKAILFTSYTETLTVTNGTFTDNGCDAILVGNMLYLYFNVKSKAAISAGNI